MINKLRSGFCKNKEIRITLDDKYVSIFDIIKIVGGQAKPKNVWYSIKDKNHILEFYYFQFNKTKKTPCYLVENISELIKIVLVNSRINYEQKEIIMKHFDIPYDNLYVKTYIEEEIHNNILKVFSNEDFVQQYNILDYRIDLYSEKYNIAIECDEYHASYNKEKEETRHLKISNTLKCTWIRYNPYDTNFDIFILIKQIYDLIKHY